MKPVHIGLLVIGAALAGGLAVRMAAPPPLPAPSRVRAIAPAAPPPPVAPAPAASSTRKVEPLPAPRTNMAQVTEVAPAPPPIYSEPPHVEQTVRRTPFGEVAARPPAEVAKVFHPSIAPVPYEPEVVKQTAPVVNEPPAAEPPHVAPRPPHQAVLRAGSPITVRLVETLSSEHVVAGDMFHATLADPLVVDGLIVAERGAQVTGRVADARRAGHLSGVSSLELRLLDLITADGQRVAISCDPWLKRGESAGRGSAEKIGGGAALGTIIGAIAGGGVGAVIGAGAGGGLGAGAAAITGAKPVSIPSETVLRFRLSGPVTITERQL